MIVNILLSQEMLSDKSEIFCPIMSLNDLGKEDYKMCENPLKQK